MKEKFEQLLRWSEKYTGTDMIYIIKGGFWLILGKGIMSLISFLKMIAFGRLVPQDVYGSYNFIIATIAIFAVFSLPGIDTSIIRSISRKKDGTFSKALKAKLKYSLIGSIGVFTLSFWYFSKSNHQLGMSFLVAGIFFPLFYSLSIFSSFWIGRKKFDVQNKYEVLSYLFTSILIIGTLFLTNNVFYIILVLFISQSLFNGILLKKTFNSLENKEQDKEAISFGKNLTIMSALSDFANQIDKIIVWKFLGPIQLAIYSFALLPAQKMMTLIPVSSLALPKLGESELKGRKKGIADKTKKLFFLSIPLAIFLVLISPLIYRLFFPSYIESIPYFRFFAILVSLFPLTLFESSLISQIKKRELYKIKIFVPILKILLFVPSILIWGIWGIAGTIILAQIIEGLMFCYYFKKI